jgi:sulfate adenylyltransferase subunit 2
MSDRVTASLDSIQRQLLADPPSGAYWDAAAVHDLLTASKDQSKRSTERFLAEITWLPKPINIDELRDEEGRELVTLVADSLHNQGKRQRLAQWVVQTTSVEQATLVTLNDGRHSRRWRWIHSPLNLQGWCEAVDAMLDGREAMLWPHQVAVTWARRWMRSHGHGSHQFNTQSGCPIDLALGAYRQPRQALIESPADTGEVLDYAPADHLGRLEAESIHIMREVMAQADNPVMLYSVGKDSAVMLHLARKAFYPSAPPFPLMHVDTRWKFRQMYDFRDQMAQASGMPLIVHINPEGVAQNVNPFDHGSALHTDIMKTQGLRQALDEHGFDVAFWRRATRRRKESRKRAGLFVSYGNPSLGP